MPNKDNITPIMSASSEGDDLRGPPSLISGARSPELTRTVTPSSTAPDHHDTVRLLSDIDSAGGRRPYATACRMAYVRIRHEVSKTYAALEEGHDDRALLHFLFAT